MKKLIITLSILLIAIPAFAVDYAVIKEVSGRVEYQSPGGSWIRATAGDSLAQGASISTGFGASAVVEVGASILQVEALTRMKLEELVQARGTQTTGLYLRVGRVTAEVKRDEGLSHNFKLRSPSSTAAVRGTNFTYDGHKVIVHRGAVGLIGNALAREVLVAANESGNVNPDGTVSGGEENNRKNSETQGNAGRTEGGSNPDGSTGGSTDIEFFGNITITVQ